LEKGKFTGIGRTLRNFLSFAAEQDRENEYVLFGNQKTEYVPAGSNQTLKIIPERITVLWDQFLLPLAIRRERVDVFLTPYFKAPLWHPSKLVVIINDLIPLMVPVYRSAAYGPQRAYFKFLTRLALRSADAIVAISDSTKRDICRVFRTPEERIFVIDLAVEPRYAAAAKGAHEVVRKYGVTEKFIFYSGNFKPHKNISALLTAYAQLPEALRREHVLLLGSPKDEGFRAVYQRVKDLDLQAQVVFLDGIKEYDLPYFYSAASIFVFPSLYEGFGLPVLEAMAAGAPVVTSNMSSLPEVAGDAALLVDPADSSALAAAMKAVLQDSQLRGRLIQKGRERSKDFSVERMGEQLRKVLNMAIGGRSEDV
jgi:glycosyltransferase involved in cell wall biosynthesis